MPTEIDLIVEIHATKTNGKIPICNSNGHKSNGYRDNEHTAIHLGPPTPSITYPTQSLQFLKTLDVGNVAGKDRLSSFENPIPARSVLNIVVVGAGLGGLGLAIALARRGHSVRMLEQASKLGEVGNDFPTCRSG